MAERFPATTSPAADSVVQPARGGQVLGALFPKGWCSGRPAAARCAAGREGSQPTGVSLPTCIDDARACPRRDPSVGPRLDTACRRFSSPVLGALFPKGWCSGRPAAARCAACRERSQPFAHHTQRAGLLAFLHTMRPPYAPLPAYRPQNATSAAHASSVCSGKPCTSSGQMVTSQVRPRRVRASWM
jgi:hypothetical protein